MEQSMSTDRIIDSHQHFWKYDPVRYAWITEDMRAIRTDFTPYDLLQELRENGVSGSVVVQADPSENETAYLVSVAERHDFVLGAVGWVDFCRPGVEERLSFYHRTAPKLKGFRHIVQAEPDDAFLLRDDFCRGIAALKPFDYTYDILIYPRQLPAAIRFVERFPDQPFVVDHLAKPDIKGGTVEPWAAHIREMARFPQVYCKVSGMVTEADWRHWNAESLRPYLDVVFEAFGPERLMFGSDWPVCLVAAQYQQVLKVLRDYLQAYSPAQQQAVMGGNAASFYHLNP